MMKNTKHPIRAFWLITGLTGVLLQLYIFICGCSTPAAVSLPSGKSLYNAKCRSCHRLLPPQDHTADTWRDYVNKYGKRLPEADKQQMLDYLEQNAAVDNAN